MLGLIFKCTVKFFDAINFMCAIINPAVVLMASFLASHTCTGEQPMGNGEYNQL